MADTTSTRLTDDELEEGHIQLKLLNEESATLRDKIREFDEPILAAREEVDKVRKTGEESLNEMKAALTKLETEIIAEIKTVKEKLEYLEAEKEKLVKRRRDLKANEYGPLYEQVETEEKARALEAAKQKREAIAKERQEVDDSDVLVVNPEVLDSLASEE